MQGFTDLGDDDVIGQPVSINDSDEILTSKGVWHDGSFIAPKPVPGANPAFPAMNMTDIDDAGTVVGWAARNTVSFSSTHSAYWNSRTTATPSFYPTFDVDALSAACSAQDGSMFYGSDQIDSVTASGEGGGSGAYYGTPSCGGTGFALTVANTASTDTHVTANALLYISELNSQYAIGKGNGITTAPGETLLDNRADNSTTRTNLDVDSNHSLDSSGDVIGEDITDQAQVEWTAGTETAFAKPAGGGVIAPQAINDAKVVVGNEFPSAPHSKETALRWTSPGVVATLDSDPNVPAGWHLKTAYAINQRGDITGTGTDPDGNEEDYLLLAASPDLSASISLSDGDGNAFTGGASSVGKTLLATVTLTEQSTAAHPITGIAVDPQGLAVAPGAALTYVANTTPATSLSPGQSTTYTVTYTVASPGQAKLTVDASGVENGAEVDASASTIAHLGQPLNVTVAFQQGGVDLSGASLGANTIKLADADAGEIAQDVTAVVTLTNVAKTAQTGLSFQGLPAVSFHNPANPSPTLPLSVAAGPAPATLPDLAPGQSTKASYTLHVDDNGVADISPQVLSTDAGTSDNNISQGVGTLTSLPTALLWLELHPVTTITGLIPAGSSVQVEGTLTNRSRTQTVDIPPIAPSITGNAGGGMLRDPAQGPLADGVLPAYTGLLAPGADQEVTATLVTSPIAATRATVSYAPAGFLVNDDGTQTPLSGSQLGQASTTVPMLIHISTADPVVTPSGFISVAANFTGSALLNSSIWVAGNLQAGAELVRNGQLAASGYGLVKGTAKIVVGTAQAAAEAAWFTGAMYTLSIGWESLTPAERTGFADQIASDFETSNLGTAYKALDLTYQTIDRDSLSWANSFYAASSRGDYNAAADIAGKGFSEVGDQALSLYLSDIALQKLALGIGTVGAKATAATANVVRGQLARAITLEDAIRDAKVATTLGKGAEGIVAGQNLLADGGAVALKVFGLLPEQVAALRKFCQQNKIIVAVRGRSAQAAQLIKDGLAVGKNEAIKIKNVNEIDTAYLGYQAHDLNTVVWAEPIPRSELLSNISHLDPEMQEVVTARYDLRVEQWNDPGIKKVIAGGEKTGFISWDFNGTSNGAPYVRKQTRRFDLYQTTPAGGSGGRYYAKVLVGNKAGKLARLVPITQDVDMMALLQANGKLLPSALRAKAYAFLSDVIGIEHGETPSWIKDGEIIFNAKAKQLAETIPQGSPLAVFGPDGSMRGGFFDPALTIFDKAGQTGYVFFKGGYNNPYAATVSRIVSKLKGFVN